MGRQVIRTVACGLVILFPLLGNADPSSILGPTGRDNRPEKERIDKRPHASDEILSQSFLIQVSAREALIQAESLKIALSAARLRNKGMLDQDPVYRSFSASLSDLNRFTSNHLTPQATALVNG